MLSRLVRHIEVGLAELDLTLPQYRTLGFLAEGEEASSRLAAKLAVSPPSVTAVVDGLVARKLVERRPVPDDRRRHQLLITAQGRKLLATADGAVDDRLTTVLSHVSNADAKAARHGLELWEQALNSYRSSLQVGARA